MGTARTEAIRLRSELGHVVVGGDVNWRLGKDFLNWGPRDTEDQTFNDPRLASITYWFNQTNLRSIYGLPGQHKEVFTSRNNKGQAAPDMIAVDLDGLGRGRYTALPPPSFEELGASSCHVHRPIGILCTTSKVIGGEDGGRGKSEGNSAPHTVPLEYGNDVYVTNSGQLHSILKEAARATAQGNGTLGVINELCERMRIMQDSTYRSQAPCDPSAKRAARTAYSKRTKHQPNPVRQAAGRNIPTEAARLCKETRKLFVKIKQAERDASLTPMESKARVGELTKERVEKMQQRDIMLAKFFRHNLKSYVDRMVDLLRRNPHRFYKEFVKLYPEDAEVLDEGNGIPVTVSQAATTTKFLNHFKALATASPTAPDGMRNEEWLRHIPSTSDPASAEMLESPVTPQEVFRIVYHSHKEVDGDLCHNDGCDLCATYVSKLMDGEMGSPFQSITEHLPHIHTSKASGPDGVFAETLRWTGPKPEGERLKYRQDICGYLATIFSAIIADGAVPDINAFRECILTPLHKTGDKSDPSNYRGICTSGLMGKVFGLIMTTRIAHWAHTNNIISPEQVGFMQYHGCEYHIMTLVQALRSRMRGRLASYVCFIDFKKAYDNCNLELAWTIFSRMGIPARVVELLRHWFTGIAMRVLVNGTLSPPFPQTKGFPQGGVLSPICFALMIEPLIRSVKGMTRDHGLDIMAGTHKLQFLLLVYADDIVLMTTSRASLEVVTTHVHTWAKAHGFELGLGAGKTMAMFFPSDGHTEPLPEKDLGNENTPIPPRYQQEPLHLEAGVEVQWTFQYKYLGYRLRMDLRDDSAIKAATTNLKSALNRLFPHNRLLHGMPMSQQIQLLQTIAVGCVSFILPFIDLSNNGRALKEMDRAVEDAISSIANIDHRKSNVYLRAATGVPSFYAIALSARQRLIWALELHPLNHERRRPIACTMLQFLKEEHALRQVHDSRGIGYRFLSNWYTMSMEFRTFPKSPTVKDTVTVSPPAVPLKWSEVGPQAAVFKRRIEYVRWNNAVLYPPPAQPLAGDIHYQSDSDPEDDDYKGPPLPLPTPSGLFQARPPLGHIITHIQYLYNVKHFQRVMDGVEGQYPSLWATDCEVPRQAPLSLQAPSCTSVVALSKAPPHKSRVILASRLGSAAMAMKPFALSMSVINLMHPTRGDDQATSSTTSAFKYNYAATRRCKLCGGCSTTHRSGIFHYINECTHPGLAKFQRKLRRATLHLIQTLAKAAHKRSEKDAQRDTTWAADPGDKRYATHRARMAVDLKKIYQELRRLIRAAQNNEDIWSNTYVQSMLYRILLVVPFSARSLLPTPIGVPRAPGIVLVTSLLFDNIVWPNNTLRPICTLWVNWSYKRIMKLANTLNVLRPQIAAAAARSRVPSQGTTVGNNTSRSHALRAPPGKTRRRSQSPSHSPHPNHTNKQGARSLSAPSGRRVASAARGRPRTSLLPGS